MKEVKRTMITINYKEEDFSVENLYLQNMKYMLNRLQSMFIYKGLPDTIPEQELEGILFKYGSCFITKVNDSLYAFPYSPVNNLDVYENFTQVNVNNVALNISKTYEIGEGVICDNDFMRLGLFPIMSKYSRLLAENTITIKNVDILLRMTTLISASDNITKASAENYLEKLKKGELAIIGESPFFNGIKVNGNNSGMQNYIHQFIELQQYLKGSFFNELGLNANFNMKNVAIGANESALNRDFLHPLVDNMKECRETFIKELNKKYNLNIEVEFNSSWKMEEEEKNNPMASELNQITYGAESIKNLPENEGKPVKNHVLLPEVKENEKGTETDKQEDNSETETIEEVADNGNKPIRNSEEEKEEVASNPQPVADLPSSVSENSVSNDDTQDQEGKENEEDEENQGNK